MIKGIGQTANSKCALNFGTHSDVFHCDDVTGTAIFEMAFMDKDIYVIRTKDAQELNKLDVVIDIGGGELDHHMAGFNVCRTTGEKYASAGLVWKKFGELAIKNVMIENGMDITEKEIGIVKDQIDREIIVFVDMEDNGEKVSNHVLSFVTQFLPTWLENPDYDVAFLRVEKLVYDILKEYIKNKITQFPTKKELQKRYSSIEVGILEIPAQRMQWLEEILNYNESHNNAVKFVIFPYPAGGWAAHCVPPSMKDKFKQLVPFPKEWAGGNKNTLPTISGITDAIFCHNGRFFARAESRQSVIKMCRIAMNLI